VIVADPLVVAALAFFLVIAVGTLLVGINDWLEARHEELLARGMRGVARIRMSGSELARAATRGNRGRGLRLARAGARRCGDSRTVVSDWF
jgi:hypothetical protein